MRLGLESAALGPEAIGYVNAHGTATEVGDIAESQATAEVFGTGRSGEFFERFSRPRARCLRGSIEAWLSIEMMRDGWFAPNRGLEEVDPRCGELDYIRDEPRKLETPILMSNNFAFGGSQHVVDLRTRCLRCQRFVSALCCRPSTIRAQSGASWARSESIWRT